MSDRPFWLRGPRVRSPYVLDGAIAAVLGGLLLMGLTFAETTDDYPREPDALAVLFVVVGAGALAFRRRQPVVVLGLTLVAALASYVAGYPDHGLPFTVMVALYTVASRCERRLTIPATAAVLVAVVVAFAVAQAGDLNPGAIVSNFAIFTVAAVWGDRKQVREAYVEQLELRAAEKERERREEAERAVGEERLRIARELHDVVAHAMSVVAVQSGVGAHVIDSNPAEAKRLLETIAETSRDSLEEMRRLLGVLRDEAGGDQLAPAPGLGGLDELAARVTEAGVPVDVTVRGAAEHVPAGVELAAYRIVQEALTNVIKHAGRANASVLVRHEPGAIHLEVVDDGRGLTDPAGANGSGHGLVGMRERTALYDGSLEAGPRTGGGFRVAATLRFTPVGGP